MSLRVHDFHVNERHIRAVRQQALRAGVGGQLQALRIAGGLDFVLANDFAAVAAHRLNRTRLEGDVGERENVAIGRRLHDALGLAVHEQFHGLAMIRGHVHGLLRVRGIGPVADDVDVRLLVLHDAVDEIGLLGQADGVHLAADAADFAAVLAAVWLLSAKIDRGVAGPFGVRGIGVGDADWSSNRSSAWPRPGRRFRSSSDTRRSAPV